MDMSGGERSFTGYRYRNTRTVYKKYYIHPKIISQYESGTLQNFFVNLIRLRRLTLKPVSQKKKVLFSPF